VDLGPDGAHHLLVESGAADMRERVREALAAAAAARRREEVERGACLVGPHRDELDLSVRGLPARGYASHGEAWSLALALRLGTFDLLSADDEPGAQPVLVLDDVFAELDGARRRHLADRAARAEQALVSAAVAEDVPDPTRGRVVTVVRDPGTGLSRLAAA
jgi:DNA replication and repair protein RecF